MEQASRGSVRAPGALSGKRPAKEKALSGFENIREQMEVIGADGVHLGTRIKLVRADSGVGHEQHHHYIPRGLVADVEGDKVRLTARGDVVADLFEQEESGQPLDAQHQ